jgi:predicted DNA-binding transcriptional regulator AlpA
VTTSPAPVSETNGRKRQARRPLPPALLRPGDSAAYCGVSRSAWDRLAAAALTPAPIRLGGALAWSRHELKSWTLHGCPPRADWVKIWVALRGRPARRK